MSTDAEILELAGHGEAGSPATDIDTQLLSLAGHSPQDIAAASTPKAAIAAPAIGQGDLPWYERFAHGYMDQNFGDAQLLSHVVPDKWQSAISLPTPDARDEWMNNRERDYQNARGPDAGIDVARFAGNMANPINWIAPFTRVGKAMLTAAPFWGGAALTLPSSLAESSTTPGNYWGDKANQVAWGAAIGGAMNKVLNWTGTFAKYLRGKFGSVSDTGAAQRAADDMIDQAFRFGQVDPGQVHPGMMQEFRNGVRRAIETGTDPDFGRIARMGDAASLPVPIRYTEGQASRDPMLFSKEMNMRGLNGVGEPITSVFAEQNRNLIENLNVMGARNAPSQIDTSRGIIDAIQSIDNGLETNIDTAYGAVRNSTGRSALMDHVAFVKAANDALDKENGPFLPTEIRKQINDISSGKLPLTVQTMQNLDKLWGAEQRKSGGAAAYAIGSVRAALNNAPISDSVGQEAMQAYQAARGLAKQRFSLIDANPAYEAVINGRTSAEPENFFQKFIQNGTAKDLNSLQALVSQHDPALVDQLRATTMGAIKNKVLGGASDENGIFSQAKLNGLLSDTRQSARLETILEPDTMDNLRRLGRVSGNILVPPKAATVNTSNTASTAMNLAKDVGKSYGWRALSWATGGAAEPIKNAVEAKKASGMVRDMLNPGVTKEKMPALTIEQQRLANLLTVGSGIAASRIAAEPAQ